MTKLIANIVGRNEADKYLDRILSRLADQVDEICFTDDHSDDNTAGIAASYGAHVMVMPEPTFMTHEGKLRQASWEHLESVVGNDHDWFVLAIDCDEELYDPGNVISSILDQNHFDVANIQFYHMWNETQFRVDKAWAPHPSSRLFRYFSNGVFQQRALACGSEPMYVQGLIRAGKYLGNSGLVMKHLSYIKDEDKQAKYERYAKIDGGAFHANTHIESILDKEPFLIDWSYT